MHMSLSLSSPGMEKEEEEQSNNEEKTKESHNIGFMYRAPMDEIVTDKIISRVTGAKYVHVDIVFIPPLEQELNRKEVCKQLFSTFVGEYFKPYTPKMWDKRNNSTHSMYVLSVSSEEYDSARKYMADLCVQKVSYNYTDLTLCGLPRFFSATLASDVDPYPIPKSVYCSQAAILMLRNAIQPSRINAPLVETLKKVNSRACSPMTLLHLLEPYCTQVDVAEFVSDTGTLKPLVL